MRIRAHGPESGFRRVRRHAALRHHHRPRGHELPPAAIPSRFSRHSQGVNLRCETFGDSLHGTNVNRKLAPLHRRRALWTSTVNMIQNYGDVRDSLAGALLGTWCGARGPQEPAEPVKGRSAPIPSRNRLQRLQDSRYRDLQSPRVEPGRRGFTFQTAGLSYCPNASELRTLSRQ